MEDFRTTSRPSHSSHTCQDKPWLEGQHRQPPTSGIPAGHQHTRPHHSRCNYNRGEALSRQHRGHGGMQPTQHHPMGRGDRAMHRYMTPTRTPGMKTKKTIHLQLLKCPTHGRGPDANHSTYLGATTSPDPRVSHLPGEPPQRHPSPASQTTAHVP